MTNGGEVLFLAACPNGIGEPQTLANFYNRLTAPLEEVIQSIRQDYVLYSHKPYKFAVMIRRLRRIWMHSQIPDNLVSGPSLSHARPPGGGGRLARRTARRQDHLRRRGQQGGPAGEGDTRVAMALPLPRVPALCSLTPDGWLLFATRCVRLFAYGLLSVILVLYLAALGLSNARSACC